MVDKYSNFNNLAAAEPAESYHVLARDCESHIVIAAPHAGGIEPGTSEISRAIAGDDLSLYLFEGLKPRDNRDLHMTSSNFDEPQCRALLQRSGIVLTVHGEQSERDIVFLGGLHISLSSLVRTALEEEGFIVQEHVKPGMQGIAKENICNIGRSGAGVQLEIPKGLRRTFFASLTRRGRAQPTPRFDDFCLAVRGALHALP